MLTDKMDQQIRNLLAKYTHDQCSEDELRVVDDILKSGKYLEEWKSVMAEEALADTVMPDVSCVPVFRQQDVFARIEKHIPAEEKGRSMLYRVSSIAATMLLGIFAAYWFIPGQPDAVAMKTYRTAPGEQKNIKLPDGSDVFLNNASSIRVATSFSNGKREIYLQGEAFFDVVQDKKRPFIVHTNNLNVQVLGTSFNIKAYANESHAAVCVATGKVGVGKDQGKSEFTLLPSDHLLYDARERRFKKSRADLAEVLAWRQNELVFTQDKLSDIVLVLQRRYNVKISFEKEELRERRVTGRFSEIPFQTVLSILSQTAGFSYRTGKGEVIIQPLNSKKEDYEHGVTM